MAAIESGQQPVPPAQPKDQPQQLGAQQPAAQSQPAPAPLAAGSVPTQGVAAPAPGPGTEQSSAHQQAQAQAVATQAVLESQVGDTGCGFILSSPSSVCLTHFLCSSLHCFTAGVSSGSS